MNKLYPSPKAAIEDVFDGASIAVGGFFVAGVPLALIKALIEKGTQELTLCCGVGPLLGFSDNLDALVSNRQIKKIIESYPFFRSASRGMASLFEQAIRAGEIDVEVFPMGTLAEKYRCGGAGIPAFFTPTGVGTFVAEDKEHRDFNGVTHIMETSIRPDFAFVHAYMGDTEGNLMYRKTARNFSPEMAAAARITIAEVENLVEPGVIDPDKIHTPGVYVQRVVKVDRPTFRIGID